MKSILLIIFENYIFRFGLAITTGFAIQFYTGDRFWTDGVVLALVIGCIFAGVEPLIKSLLSKKSCSGIEVLK